jgi:OmpA family
MKRIFLLCSLLALVACAQPAPPPPAAAAPPPPPPPPPAQHNFTVFFDWDRANVTPDGQQIVEAAAATYKTAPGPVQVVGHTDTSGTAAFNQKLSDRRAQNVAKVLVQSGVPQDQLNVSGVGENDLKVPTPDGVREAQNRRTEIIVGGGGAAPPPAAAPPSPPSPSSSMAPPPPEGSSAPPPGGPSAPPPPPPSQQ